MYKVHKNEKGITLIALIVTIIIMLILAGVTLNIAIGDNGLFIQSKRAVEKYKEEAAREKLNMALAEYTLLANSSDAENIEESLKELGDVTDKGDYYEVVIDGYVYDIKKDTLDITNQGPAKEVKITEITAKENSKNIHMYVGETKEIELDIQPAEVSARHLNFTSGDNKIATVNERGKIIGVSAGETTITITAKNDEKIKATITVTVAEKPVPKEIELSYSLYNGAYDGQNHPAVTNVTVNPSDAKMTYSLNGGAYSETVPQVNGANTYTVTIKAEKEGYVTKEITETITINKQGNNTSNLTLSATSGTTTYGTPITINVTNNVSGGSISAESSDTSVAEVTVNGNQITITPKEVSTDSTAIITVKSEATGNYEEQTATYSVTVKLPRVTSISLNPTTLELDVGATSSAIQVAYTPSNAINKTVTWSANPTSVATVDSNGVVTGVKAGTVTITATPATGSSATCTVTVKSTTPETPTYSGDDSAISITEAKAAIARDVKTNGLGGLKIWIGQKVDYKPKAGGTWRVFYYNTAAEWGEPAGTLYLKRDYDTNLKRSLTLQTSPSSDTLQRMKNMNPMWDNHGNSALIGSSEYNDQGVAWLCDSTQWTDYSTSTNGTTLASYAIGSPSVEMYMKAYNIWIAGTSDITTSSSSAKTLMCKVDNTTGYKVGAFGSYTYGSSSEYYTGSNTLQAGPKNIFMTSGLNYLWLASPSGRYSDDVCLVSGDSAGVGNSTCGIAYGVCPVVSINP